MLRDRLTAALMSPCGEVVKQGNRLKPILSYPTYAKALQQTPTGFSFRNGSR